MAKFSISSAVRSKFFPAHLTRSYEENISHDPSAPAVGHQRNSFCGGMHIPDSSGHPHRPEKKRLAAAIVFSEYFATAWRAIRGALRAGLRSHAHKHFREQSCEYFRSVCGVLGYSTICARV